MPVQKKTMLVTDFVKPLPEIVPYQRQAAEVPGTKKPGATGIYRNAIFGYIDSSTPGVLQAVDEVFAAGLKGGRDRKFLGHRPVVSTSPLKFANYYVWQTYGEVDLRRRWIGSALVKLFNAGELGGGDLQTVGIWSPNRPDWQVVDIALQSYQKVGVSLYDTLGKDAVEYIVTHAHVSIAFTTADHIPALLKMASSIPMLRQIVSLDALPAEAWNILQQWSHTVNVKLWKISEFEEFGRSNLTEPIKAKPDDIYSLCYTSGTTSNPKGVILTHKMMAISTQSQLYGLILPDDATMMSFLPLAHIYERVSEMVAIAMGASIGFFTGDPARLMEDAQVLKPHFMPAVPRVFNRIYQGALAGGDVPGLKGAIFRYAVQTKLTNLRTTGTVYHALWDRIVFRKVRAALGGQLETMICGSAPVNKDVLDFLKIALCCNILEGYGMTETCATTTRAVQDDPTAGGTVGPITAASEMKLLDVPQMGYTSEDKPHPRGELLLRGEGVFTYYYKDEKNTKEAVDAEGWMHTGDVAAVDECGRLKIIDRVKNIMKLSQGEYVALEKIENTYSACSAVAQIYVHGDGLQPYLIGVIVPDPVQFAGIVSKVSGTTVAPEDVAVLAKAAKDPKVNAAVMRILNQEGKKNGLKGFEYVKRVVISLTPFSVENNTLTPTLKIKRKDAYKLYQAELDALYALGEPGARPVTRL